VTTPCFRKKHPLISNNNDNNNNKNASKYQYSRFLLYATLLKTAEKAVLNELSIAAIA